MKAFSRVLQKEDAYVQPGDFGHEYSTIRLKFAFLEKVCVYNM